MILHKEKAAGGNQTAIILQSINYNVKASFSKENLPPPKKVLELLNIRYLARGGDWIQVFCPFHANGQERNSSLSMHTQSGHYKCHACGAKGGDVIAFYRAITGCGFREALKDLRGCHV